MGKRFIQAIESLAQATGQTDISITNYANPITLAGNVQLLLLTSASDLKTLQTEAKDKPAAGMFGKLFGGKSATDPSSPNASAINANFFEYLPIQLFETLHHNQYNGKYASYRQAVDKLQLESLSFDMKTNGQAAEIQTLLQQLNDKKKVWNNADSWAMKTIQRGRDEMMKASKTK